MKYNNPTLVNMLRDTFNYGIVINYLADERDWTNAQIATFLQYKGIVLDNHLKGYIHDYGNDSCDRPECPTHA